MLLAKSIEAAHRELSELKAFAVTQGFTEELNLWDVQYWSERLREKRYFT
jgi:oligopeptidase A